MIKTKKIIFVTGNPVKILHANTALKNLGFSVVGQKLEIIEPREEEPERVVIEKAVQAFQQLKKPLIVEDSGIFISALGGFPKTFVHFALNTLGVKNILKLMEGMENRSAEFRQSLAYVEPGMAEPKVFSYIDGGFTLADRVWEDKVNDSGEFDKVLIPPGESKPLSMFSKEWRAKRDAEQNKGAIHYEQLAYWLKSRE
jgi:XTP/dITP diphosphohydrolase